MLLLIAGRQLLVMIAKADELPRAVGLLITRQDLGLLSAGIHRHHMLRVVRVARHLGIINIWTP